MSDKIVGILGKRGGQLGRMLVASASLLNVKVVILDVGENAPAKQILAPIKPELAHVDGSFTDAQKILELAKKVDILTVEIEHVDADVLDEVAQARKVQVHPSPSTIRLIQDKYNQKKHLQKAGIAITEFFEIPEPTPEAIHAAIDKLGLPLMVKSRTLAYDGRGNFPLRHISQIEEALAALKDRPLYAEKWVNFEREIAVMVVRTVKGAVASYPAVETVHMDNICLLTFAPLRSSDPATIANAQSLAESAILTFEGAGIFGVELFQLPDGILYVNEIAPRPHNSGHYTIEACETSQYENHLRAILNLPLGSTSLKAPSSVMLNLIGGSSDMSQLTSFVGNALSVPGAAIHMYGKSECRKGRKMGHLTIVGDSDAQVNDRLRPLLSQLPNPMTHEEIRKYAPHPPGSGALHDHPNPLVGVIMGSDSDLGVMIPAAKVLDRFDIPYELTIVSAHRTPDRMVQYARSAAARGLRVIIAGAGGAAHLPGMVAAMTALPVIGVPVKGSSLDGVDSLHSIVQMPRGIPVATVAINNSMNAGLLAVRVLSAGIPRLIEAMENFLREQEKEVLGKVSKLQGLGWGDYEKQRTGSS
ncbi:Phosphoribosylaminoimidazole carboxylase [Thelephora ganbajun]|uniref:Phosphoribosylaminoimidazole carboxylase n=1 Tax=Thelephora ganbajun TaxID=370292 RepID=A0ACB6ZU62_THEGA|nr:Phosphoribosylaminoimidazole carboxylase [Thelephora ganbajun]